MHHGAECRYRYDPPPAGVAGVQLWAKPLGNGQVTHRYAPRPRTMMHRCDAGRRRHERPRRAQTAALLINGGGVPYTASVSLAELNVSATDAGVKVTDVWSGSDAGPIVGGNWSTGSVPPLDSRFVVFAA